MRQEGPLLSARAFTELFEPPLYKILEPNPGKAARWGTLLCFTLPHFQFSPMLPNLRCRLSIANLKEACIKLPRVSFWDVLILSNQCESGSLSINSTVLSLEG